MNVVETVDAYVAAWNEREAVRRNELLGQSFNAEGTYRDPLYAVAGRDALVQHIGGYQQRFPDASMERKSDVDGYADVARFAWAIVGPDGVATLQGVDIVALDEDGRIRSITGFFGELT